MLFYERLKNSAICIAHLSDTTGFTGRYKSPQLINDWQILMSNKAKRSNTHDARVGTLGTKLWDFVLVYES